MAIVQFWMVVSCVPEKPSTTTNFRQQQTLRGRSLPVDDNEYWAQFVKDFFEDVKKASDKFSMPPSRAPSDKPSSRPPTFSPTPVPTVLPTIQPTTLAPTALPSENPSDKPSSRPPTFSPTPVPTVSPTIQPTTLAPTARPSEKPSDKPSSRPPSFSPTPVPTVSPTIQPTTEAPTARPTENPSSTPTIDPTTMSSSVAPSGSPTTAPTVRPTNSPAGPPTARPSKVPSRPPTGNPTTNPPTGTPTETPTTSPTIRPSNAPTAPPAARPSNIPSSIPTTNPTTQPPFVPPTETPTLSPTVRPSASPQSLPTTVAPTEIPTLSPTVRPSASPQSLPTTQPSMAPSQLPTRNPTTPPPNQAPTTRPTESPTNSPPVTPSNEPSRTQEPSISRTTPRPSQVPSQQPTFEPTDLPTTRAPANIPMSLPTLPPTDTPAALPSAQPTNATPSNEPSRTQEPSISRTTPRPNQAPSQQPTFQPTDRPTRAPANIPMSLPTLPPTATPATFPSAQPTNSEPCQQICQLFEQTLEPSGPFTTGTLQAANGRSTCESQKPFPGIESPGQQIPFTSIGPFCNEETTQQCARVIVNIDECVSGGIIPLVHVAAYNSTFDPSNIETGYLGDGERDSFSLAVPPQGQFYLIGFFTNLITPQVLPCTYSVAVEIGQCSVPTESPISASPTAAVSPTSPPTFAPTTSRPPICEELPQTFANPGQRMNGRLQRNDTIPTNCDGPRPFPGQFGAAPRYYNVVGPFVNDEPNTRCATLVWDYGTCTIPSNTSAIGFDVLIHPSVYTSFNPNDLSSGYISDPGTSASPRFDFLVPGETEFVFVAQSVFFIADGNARGVLGCSYSITVLFDDCFSPAPSVPSTEPSLIPTTAPSDNSSLPPTISPSDSTCTSVCEFLDVSLVASPPFSDGAVLITPEISTCTDAKQFPGVVNQGQQIPFESIGPFCNESPEQACATVQVDPSTCLVPDFNLPLVHVVAYSSFNESNVQQNYLGDGQFETFEITLEPQSKLFLVGFYSVDSNQEFLPCTFRVSVDIGQCNPTQRPTSAPSRLPPLTPTQTPTMDPATQPPVPCQPFCQLFEQMLEPSGPFTTGTLQAANGRSTCESQKPFPGIESPGQQIPFTSIGPFCNEETTQQCARVIVNIDECVSGGIIPLVHVAAYNSTFDPSNIETGYLGDGERDSFSLVVPPQGQFYLIGFFTNLITPQVLPCTYSVAVEIGQCSVPTESPISASPTAAVSPTSPPTFAPTTSRLPICEELPQTFANPGQRMNGRLQRNDTIPTNCDGPRPFPGQFGAAPRYYNVVGPFVNDEPNTRCATLVWDYGTCTIPSNTSAIGFDVLIHPSVYTSFNPNDLSSGYISDPGTSASPRFDFLVPGETEFVFVAQSVFFIADGNARGVLGCSYSITVLFDDCFSGPPEGVPTESPSRIPMVSLSPAPSFAPSFLPTLGPTNVPNCQTIPSIFVNSSDVMSGRIRRTLDGSTCENNKAYPGTLFATPFLYNAIGPFVNNDSVDRCVTIEWDFGNCTANNEVLIQPTAYTQFDPSDQASGYLGDGGNSDNPSFSFVVPAQTEFVFVAQELQPVGASQPGLAIGCSYSIRVVLDCPTETEIQTQQAEQSVAPPSDSLLCKETGCVDVPLPSIDENKGS
ncbi:hypothetical protein ACA910_004954 [Epithemia clementina (nom. ined.)]